MPSNPQLILDFPAAPEFSFDNFIEWPGARFAVAACRDLADLETAPFSSLFLSGGPGSGKTHLLLAIGNRIAATRPGRTALYMACGDFVEKFASGNGAGPGAALDPLLSVDTCLMDDVDRLAGRPDAQEKLYEVYNTLRERGAAMVFTSRIPPAGLADIADFMRSRFQWGMTADLPPMDEASAGKVFQKLGRDVGLDLPERVVTYLMHRLPRDFASLKNTVARLNAESLAQKKKVTLPLAREALGLP